MTPARATPGERTWFGQPAGLTILFLTEMWEKFSYYGMRVLLIYYMTKQLLIGQGHASLIYGLYTGFAYFTPIIGGMIADRWLGRRKAVILGGLIMAVGHFMMASEPLFFPALVAIAVGNGFFLPSLPSQIGALYAPEDPRRSGAYSIYYVGINIGALLAPLLCGAVGEIYGWHWGFNLAGVGMLVGLVIYTAGARLLPPQPPLRPVSAPRTERRTDAVSLLFAVGFAVVLLRGAYEQIGNTVALWADAQVDRTLASGVLIPLTWFQALNPLLIFLLTPVLVALWTRQARRKREPGTAVKMAIGAAVIGVAFLLLAGVTAHSESQGMPANWLWLVAFIALLTAGELWVLPVGLGLFARLAPQTLTATTVAAWFFATFLGSLLAGGLGVLWGLVDHALYFAMMAVLCAASACLLALLNRSVRAVEAAAIATPARPDAHR